MSTRNSIRALGALAAAVALSACGGGGGDTPSPAAEAPPAAPAPAPGPGPAPAPVVVVDSAGSLQTSVGAPTYAANSLAASAFSALNTARLRAGVGALAQSAQIDVAASAHAAYLTTNLASVSLTHNEDPTRPGSVTGSAFRCA